MKKKENELTINTTEWLSIMLKEDMNRLIAINKINDDYIKNISSSKDLSAKDIETLDKVSATMLKRAILIWKLQQEIIDREEAKINNKKRAEWSKLEIKLNI